MDSTLPTTSFNGLPANPPNVMATPPVPINVVPEPVPHQLENTFLMQAFTQSVHNSTAFVNALITEAIRLNASDVLFEPQKELILVRARIDGVLYGLGSFKPEFYPSIAARIKILSKLDTTERRRVQEGQFNFETDQGPVNLRVEIVQTIHEEMMVIRILKLSSVVMELSGLGFSPQALKEFQDIIETKSGLILTCGPTGSGKTTTLYSTITHLNRNNDNNVITVEDPVEYQLAHVNQMPVREDTGFTFAEGLKAILRLSPDIVLVGEIRDRETALIAVESGLTGHMVLSTIHAPDVIGVIFRLLDLGIETYLMNASLRGVVAQRLVRRNCPQCLERYQPTNDEIDLFQKMIGRPPQQLMRSKGCPVCQNLGYSGRIGIYEVLKLTSSIRNLIRSKSSEDELRQALINNHFITLLQDGLLKCEMGLTTIEEVMRNSLRVD
jgi:type IV pilus assembly protein PilB